MHTISFAGMTETNSSIVEIKEEAKASTLFMQFIQDNEDRIKALAEKFSDYVINAQRINFDEAKKRIINWLENFDKIGFNNYGIVLNLLEQIEFVKHTDIFYRLSLDAKNKALIGEKMPESTYITHLGEVVESSYKLTSHFNQNENFREGITFLLDGININDKVKILYFDDFLNSGGQIRTIFYALLNKPLPAGEINDEWEFRQKLTPEQIEKFKNAEIHIFYYTAFNEGIENVERQLKEELNLNVKIHKHLSATLNDGAFGDSHDKANIVNALSGHVVAKCSFMGKKYVDLTGLYKTLSEVGYKLLQENEPNWGEDKHQDRALGYGNYCRLTSTDYSVPTVTITALWHRGKITINGKEVLWNELLPRTKKVLKAKAKASTNTINIEEKIVQHIIINSSKIKEKMIHPIQLTVRSFLSLSDVAKTSISLNLGIDQAQLENLSAEEKDKVIFKIISEKNLLTELREELKKIKSTQNK